ncbi:DNA protection during starvation protein [uncultured Paludibacter sp.]|uniref:DNA protection during starvation protein n=1 Tax=uncultured Paludibacter sp. TaxID=497635 RepID=A0A653AKN0_9BACT|nr:DNA protection during starvation protein [uncultured Paludibacter sp.]
MKTNESTKVINLLNQVLSDLQVVYQNLRASHWLIKGNQFYQLHKFYEELYNETSEMVDEVAERILMLGGEPLHTYSDYLKASKITVVTKVPKGFESLKTVVDDQEYLLASYRSILDAADDNKDEGTVALMSDFIASTEKRLWMLHSTLA